MLENSRPSSPSGQGQEQGQEQSQEQGQEQENLRTAIMQSIFDGLEPE